MIHICSLFLWLLSLLLHNINTFQALDSYKLDSGEFPFQPNGETDVTKILTRFYVKEDGTCDKFYYKGSGGNSNNFGTEHECLEHLNDLSDWETLQGCKEGFTHTGPCSTTNDKTRYGYVASTGACSSFNYGGCGGNNNRFLLEDDCKKACEVDNNNAPNSFDCKLPPKYPESDEVKIAIVKSQDPSKTKCHYAIVDKAETRGIFPTFSKCLTTCYPANKIAACSKNAPDQETTTGEETPVVKFYYHSTDQTCFPFLTKQKSSGFEQDKNYFNTEEECMSYCPVAEDKIKEMTFQISKDACSLAAEPKQSGSLSLTKWYYNKSSNPPACTQMTHGGVGDTYGVFDSLEECNKLCGSG